MPRCYRSEWTLDDKVFREHLVQQMAVKFRAPQPRAYTSEDMFVVPSRGQADDFDFFAQRDHAHRTAQPFTKATYLPSSGSRAARLRPPRFRPLQIISEATYDEEDMSVKSTGAQQEVAMSSDAPAPAAAPAAAPAPAPAPTPAPARAVLVARDAPVAPSDAVSHDTQELAMLVSEMRTIAETLKALPERIFSHYKTELTNFVATQPQITRTHVQELNVSHEFLQTLTA